jgi:predicted acetyltransferase
MQVLRRSAQGADHTGPMQTEVRPFEGGLSEYSDVVDVAFGDHYRPEDITVFEALFERDRALGAYDGDRCIGGASIYSLDLTIPGAVLPVAGVTGVGVLPTHRRRGALRALMTRQLADVHERGEPLAALWASEPAIYQRFGYGMATLWASFEIDRTRIAWRSPQAATGEVRLVSPDEAERIFPPIHDEIARSWPGFVSRSPDFWRAQYFYDPEHWRHGASAAFHVVHRSAGRDDGYARYRIAQEWDTRGAKSMLQVVDVQAVSAAALRELWEYLFGVDLIATVRCRMQPVDSPLLLMLADPRRLGLTVADGLWVRIVDVPGALGPRRYAGEDRLVIELRDEVCPWNAGRWSLDASHDDARIERTRDDADLALDAADLGALLLGAHSMGRLLRAGRGEELKLGAAERLDALLRTDRAPWCPIIF